MCSHEGDYEIELGTKKCTDCHKMNPDTLGYGCKCDDKIFWACQKCGVENTTLQSQLTKKAG